MEGKRADVTLFGDFLPKGGCERRLANMAASWTAWGLKVECVTFRDGVMPYQEELTHLVDHHPLGTRHKLATLLALWGYLRRRRPQILLSSAHISNVIALTACRLPGVETRCYVSVGNAYGASDKNPRRQRERKLRQVRRHYLRANGIIAVSAGIRDDLVRRVGLPASRIEIIPNATVTTGLFVQAQQPVDHPWLVDKEMPVIISAGRLARQKDYPTLLRALQILMQQTPARLIILGEGSQRPALEGLVRSLGLEGYVGMPGHVDNPHAWISRSDLFVLPSLWEGLPNALIEALALGVPLVATDCPGGNAEVLDNGRHGRLVPVGDSVAMASAMAEALSKKAPRYDPGEASRPFTVESASCHYLRYFGLEPRICIDDTR